MNKAGPRHRQRSLLHHGVVALLCAFVAYLPIYALRSTALVGGASDAAVDLVMRTQADAPHARSGPATTLLHLDNLGFAQLGRPLVFPRDVLAELLTRAASAHPKLIVVDVDVSWPDSAEREQRLRAALLQLRRIGSPPVFLVREGIPDAESGASLYFAPSPYDDLVGHGSNLRWVAAALVASPDGIVRRVRPWIAVCRGGTLYGLPSVQLAAWTVLADPHQNSALDKMERRLNENLGSCKDPQAMSALRNLQLDLQGGGANRTWRDTPSLDRVVLRFSWRGSTMLVPEQGSSQIAFAVAPMGPFLKSPNSASLDLLANRIVVIGVSAAAARDLHQTPLGEMPGSMVVANLLFTQLGEGAATESGFWIGLVISLAMSSITFGVWVFSRHLFDLNIIVVREGLKLFLTAFWGIIAWVFLAHSAVPDYAFPQYVVITYLAYAEGIDQLF